ncbi:PREDICTED: late secretory pathway protein AVL9-like [Camelina sativa]|uniref:Late secretory pathway protein AVL9-like n=1 Tax=Camelina sativa TaxID=90675 RepID=A0ABM0WBR7_CAMSA|nr:PREDICTED: late secretory pathway protein AVL9-like [Camelina sativa]
MRDEIVDDVLKTLREKGLFDRSIKHLDLLQEINKSSWCIGATGSRQPTDLRDNKAWSTFMPGIPEILTKNNSTAADQGGCEDVSATGKTSGNEEDGNESESHDGAQVDSGSESEEDIGVTNDVVDVATESEDCVDKEEEDESGVKEEEDGVNDREADDGVDDVRDDDEGDKEGDEQDAQEEGDEQDA